MSTLTWVLAGVLAFWLVAVLLRARDVLPESVRAYGPIVTVHTKRGRALLDRLASPRRFWRAWGNLGLGVTLVVMVGSVAALVVSAVALLANPPETTTALSAPQNALVIPGVNPFLPLSVAPEIVLGLAIGLVIHEGGHGILCRVEDIEIESLGLLFLTVVPGGAFVQPDEESQQAADRGARSRMFAAGVTNNFAFAVLAFALLFGPVVGALGVAPGAAIGGALPGSPADQAGIARGDVITGVGNRTVASNADLDDVLSNVRDPTVVVHRRDAPPVTVSRTVIVTRNVSGAPFPFGPNTTISAVNGTRVDTTAALRDAVAERPVARLASANGTTATGPIGAYVQVADGGPLDRGGAPNGTVTITSIGGERTISRSDLVDALEARSPGETVPVALYADGDRRALTVTLGESDGEAHLGIYLIGPGVSGMELSDFGVETYPAGAYLELLGGSCTDCQGIGSVPLGPRLYFIFALPFIGVASIPILPYNFVGFVGPLTGFYTVSGPLAALGGGVFAAANLLFWAGWINLNLGLFNCIPTFMLDGGHILRASAEGVVSRLPVENGRRLALALAVGVQLLMLGSLFLMLFGRQLLA